jgi:prevent-host-death family protein
MASTVTAAAVSKNFSTYQNAAEREPVIITTNGVPSTVLIAYEDYLRLARRDRRVETTAALDDDDLATVAASAMEPGLEHLDSEMSATKDVAG